MSHLYSSWVSELDRSALWGLGDGGSVLGTGSEQRKSKASCTSSSESSSYKLCGKLSPHTQSAASSVCFLLCEETTEFKCKKESHLLAKKLLKRTLLSKYVSRSFHYIKACWSFSAANK